MKIAKSKDNTKLKQMLQEESKGKVRERSLNTRFGIVGYNLKRNRNPDAIVVCTISYLCWGETSSSSPGEGLQGSHEKQDGMKK